MIILPLKIEKKRVSKKLFKLKLMVKNKQTKKNHD